MPKNKKNKSSKTDKSSTGLKNNESLQEIKSSDKIGSSFLSKLRRTLPEDKHDKLKKIWYCLTGKDGKRDTIDLWELRLLALTPDGLLHPEIRKLAWPKLIGLVPSNEESKDHGSVSLKKHDLPYDERKTIQQDVGRTFWRLDEKSKRKIANGNHDKVTSEDILESTIVKALVECPTQLHYYQGYHDIASLLLLNTHSSTLTSSILSQISSYHFEDYMQEHFKCTMSLLQIGLWVLLGEKEEDLLVHLLNSGMQLHGFTLSWVIGWFSHDIKDFVIASRIIDVCLVSHPAMPVYLSATLLLFPRNMEMIMDTECDIASLHCTIKSLPKLMLADEEDIEEWIESALELMALISPQELISIAHEYEHEGFLDKSLQKSPEVRMLNIEVPAQHYSIATSAPVITEEDFKIPKSYELQNNMYTDLASKKAKKDSFEKVLNKKIFKRVRRHRRAIVAAGRKKEYKGIIHKRRRHRKLRQILFGSAVTIMLTKGFWQFYSKNSSGWKTLERTKKMAITQESPSKADNLAQSYVSEISLDRDRSISSGDCDSGEDIDCENVEGGNDQQFTFSEHLSKEVDQFLEEGEDHDTPHDKDTPPGEENDSTQTKEVHDDTASHDEISSNENDGHSGISRKDQDPVTDESLEQKDISTKEIKGLESISSSEALNEEVSEPAETQTLETIGQVEDFALKKQEDAVEKESTCEDEGQMVGEQEVFSLEAEVHANDNESLKTDQSEDVDETSVETSENLDIEIQSDNLHVHLEELDKTLEAVAGNIKAIKQKNKTEMMTLMSDLEREDELLTSERLNLDEELIISLSEDITSHEVIEEEKEISETKNDITVDDKQESSVDNAELVLESEMVHAESKNILEATDSDGEDPIVVDIMDQVQDSVSVVIVEYDDPLLIDTETTASADKITEEAIKKETKVDFTDEPKDFVKSGDESVSVVAENESTRVNVDVIVETAEGDFDHLEEHEVVNAKETEAVFDDLAESELDIYTNVNVPLDNPKEKDYDQAIDKEDYVLVQEIETSIIEIEEEESIRDNISLEEGKLSSLEDLETSTVKEEQFVIEIEEEIHEVTISEAGRGTGIANVIKQNVTNVGKGLRTFARNLKKELSTDDAEFLIL